jgi:hypothetical protein
MTTRRTAQKPLVDISLDEQQRVINEVRCVFVNSSMCCRANIMYVAICTANKDWRITQDTRQDAGRWRGRGTVSLVANSHAVYTVVAAACCSDLWCSCAVGVYVHVLYVIRVVPSCCMQIRFSGQVHRLVLSGQLRELLCGIVSHYLHDNALQETDSGSASIRIGLIIVWCLSHSLLRRASIAHSFLSFVLSGWWDLLVHMPVVFTDIQHLEQCCMHRFLLCCGVGVFQFFLFISKQAVLKVYATIQLRLGIAVGSLLVPLAYYSRELWPRNNLQSL